MNEKSATASVVLTEDEEQYQIGKIRRLWAGATLPLALLSWGVMPGLATRFPLAAPVIYWLLMTAGVGWVGFLALRIIRREEGSLCWQTIARRTRFNWPCLPGTDEAQPHPFRRLLPCLLVALVALVLQLALMVSVHSILLAGFPYLRWLLIWPAYANLLELVSPQFADHAWLAAGVMGLWLFTSLLAEELFFRGVLLPRMNAKYGKKDWLANGAFYLAYSIYQPWMIPARVLEVFAVVRPVRRYRSLPMGIIVRLFSTAGLLAFLWLGLYEAPPKPLAASLTLPHFCRDPQPADFKGGSGAPLTNLPKYQPDNPWFSVDLRSCDVSRLDLRESAKDLEHAEFDSQTAWPAKDRTPPGFDSAQILELAKNPGLGLRKLHAQGITGRGIGIGIVDQTLLTRHSEYAGRLKWYDEINTVGTPAAHMHGAAVSSIAVGKTVGVAPEADLYFISFGDNLRSLLFLPHYYAQGMRRLLQVNRCLPREHRIRAVSLSFGPGPGVLGFEDFISAIREAEAEGIFVAWCGEGQFPIWGLAAPPTADRDDFRSYSVSPWLLQRSNQRAFGFTGLWVPMDSRATASPTGTNDYAYYGTGGASWTVPYAAGAYALAAQVAPDITPEKFWLLALKTGRTFQVKNNGSDVTVGPIIDMEALARMMKEERPMQ